MIRAKQAGENPERQAETKIYERNNEGPTAIIGPFSYAQSTQTDIVFLPVLRNLSA